MSKSASFRTIVGFHVKLLKGVEADRTGVLPESMDQIGEEEHEISRASGRSRHDGSCRAHGLDLDRR
jgi:hypothetical protein